MAKRVGKEEEDLMIAIKERETLIEEARKKLADRIPFWEKQRDDAQEKLAEANKMLSLLRGVPAAKARAPGKRGAGTREEFMKWFNELASGTTVTLKEMSEQTGIPRGTVWGIKEAILEEGLIVESGRGVYKKI
jgi:hypothetical protein